MPQLTKAVAAAALQPRRYYLMPLRVHATYYTVTAIPKWMDKRQTHRGPEAQPSTHPVLLDVVVLILVARGVLRATSGRRRQ